jgi:alpha-L-arabinofuranosidase
MKKKIVVFVLRLAAQILYGQRRAMRGGSLILWLATSSLLVLVVSAGTVQLRNAGFESSTAAEFWQVEPSEAKQTFSMSLDRSQVKEGQQSLLISADQPVNLTLRQEIFLPVGTLWRLTGWTKSEVSSVSAAPDGYGNVPAPGPRIGVEAEVGNQGFSQPGNSAEWQQQSFLFRVPSPGRMTVALNIFNTQSGKVWLDDIRLDHVPEPAETESVTISDERLSKRPINQMQGGQFMEPLCDVLPSMTAQQVQSTSFEAETPWTYSYKAAVDKAYRPWYPDGSVHVATYSFDTNNPFNGKRSQKIEVPLAHTWAGISQDGFYIEAGHRYRLRLHIRGEGSVPVHASLHGAGGVIAAPVSLGRSTREWKGAEVVLTAKRSVQNATLTIEFDGPGTLWLDRVYLIDASAVMGLWRPDVVKALKATNAGIVRFGGSAVETFEWSDTVGNWDNRVPFPDDPWGGLQENFVGVEEFVQLVQHVGFEPLICLRWTGRTPQDAANEVEYFNGSQKTKWGALRAKNGRREPYHVKYWEIGNEVGGAEYDASLTRFGEAMRQVDPSIKILSSYPSRNIIRMAGSVLDYLSPHQYSVGDLNGTEGELKQLRDFIQQDAKGKDIRLSVTEWNASGGDWGLQRGMLQTLGNAMVCSRYQNMMHRYADLIEIANVSNFSHSFAGGQIQPGQGYFYTIPDYAAQMLYERAAGSYPLAVNRNNPLSFYLREPDLDATVSADGKTLRIYGVNSTAEVRQVSFSLPKRLGATLSGDAFVVADSSPAPDSEAMNSPDDPHRVGTHTKKLALSGSKFEYGFAPFSVTLLEIQLAKTETPAK